MNFSEDRESRDNTTFFFNEVNLQVQTINRNPILEIAIQPISFLNEDCSYACMLLHVTKHLLEAGAAGPFGRFYVDNSAEIPIPFCDA